MCPEIDTPAPGQSPVTADRLLDYAFAPEVERTCAGFVARYKELAAAGDPLPVVPAEPNILEKLIWPLRGAKGSYALGNYLSCIALCGLVGEMIAMLIWEISQVSFQGSRIDPALEKQLFGSTFERLRQERRVEVLTAAGLIDQAARESFDEVRTIRRRYLHFLSQPHAQLAGDAKRAFVAAATVVRIVLGAKFENGKVVLRPELGTYLTEKGVLTTARAGNT